MRVRDIMSSPAVTCSPSDSLEKAAQMLWAHDCGVLPVIGEHGRAIATITDRDICMGAFTKGARLADLQVANSMSKSVVTCNADDPIGTAARTMTKHGVRRLPVVDADGRVCGVLSLNDLARTAPRNGAVGRDALEVMTSVCQPRKQRAMAAVAPRPATSEAQASATTA